MKNCPFCKAELKKETKPMKVGSQMVEVEQLVCPSCRESFVGSNESIKIDFTAKKEANKRLEALNRKKQEEGLTEMEMEEWATLTLKHSRSKQ